MARNRTALPRPTVAPKGHYPTATQSISEFERATLMAGIFIGVFFGVLFMIGLAW